MTKLCKAFYNWAPCILAWTLLLSCSGAFFVLLCPELIKFIGVYGWAVVGFDVIFFLIAVVNFMRAMLMDPGIIPKADHSEEQLNDDFRSPLYKNVEINGITVRMKWCTTCKFYRPPRASHCSMCNKCIDTFDHHCPWVHNCIGRRNYRQFFFFLLSLLTHAIFVTTICIIFVVTNQDDLSTRPNLCALVLAAVSGIFSLPIVLLTMFHIVLVCRARTTNEQVTGKFRSGFNPFTHGCWKNCTNTLCSSEMPSYIKYNYPQINPFSLDEDYEKTPAVIYVPNDIPSKDGHIKFTKSIAEDDSIGTAQSLGMISSSYGIIKQSQHNTSSDSRCNLYDDQINNEESTPLTTPNTVYEQSVREAMESVVPIQQPSQKSSNVSTSSKSSIQLSDFKGSKPLKFTDAVRIHDSLNRSEDNHSNMEENEVG
uniref:Palmitoyltransferase n=1 Tax=Strongyloides venezuelensis TaxID=75913 RepID=A0A0K0F927_STRVS